METDYKILPFEPEYFDQILQVSLESAKADQVDPYSTLESMPNEQSIRAKIDDAEFVLVVKVNEEIVGFATVVYWEEDDGTCVYLHQQGILPSVRSSTIPKQLISAVQARIRDDAATEPRKLQKGVYGANASDSEPYMVELLLQDGYKQVWSQVEMEFKDFDRLPTDKRPPLGFALIEVQESDDELKRSIYKANKQVYQGWFGSSPESEDDYQEFLEENQDFSLWKVCVLENTGVIAGFVTGKIDDERAEILQVTVVDKPEFRRKGLASYLMCELLLEFQNRGVTYVRLQTDAEGKRGGRQLYEKLGFKPLKTHFRYRKPLI